MATVLEECNIEQQHSVVGFCGQKESMQLIFINKGVLFTTGSVCRAKRFTLAGKRFADDGDVETKVRKWLRKQSKDFRRTGKATGQIYQCWRRIYREINVFSRFEYPVFYVLYTFVIYLLHVPGTLKQATNFNVLSNPLNKTSIL
jgi:hypothetical protein